MWIRITAIDFAGTFVAVRPTPAESTPSDGRQLVSGGLSAQGFTTQAQTTSV